MAKRRGRKGGAQAAKFRACAKSCKGKGSGYRGCFTSCLRTKKK